MQQKLSKRIGWFAVLIVTALLGGCAVPVKTFEPLVDDKHAVSDPEIIGKWVLHRDDETLYVLEVEVEGNDPKAYRVTFSAAGVKSVYRAKLGRWDKDEFADVESVSADDSLDREVNSLTVPAHSFCHFRREGDRLWLALMDSDWAKEHLPKGKRREVGGWELPKGETGIVFTGSTEELQKFVLDNTHDEKALVEFQFAREGTLAAYSQSLEVGYEGSAKLFGDQGRYEQAAGAWQRYLALVPQDPDAHLDLALALLGSNKLGEAREEFGQRTRLCQHVPPPGHRPSFDSDEWCKNESPGLESFRLRVASFAANQYEQASHEFEKSHAQGVQWGSYEQTVWDFLALRASGKETEAQKLLDDGKIPHYSPPFLVEQYLRGRIAEGALVASAKERWQSCEACFVIGSQALIAGDKAKARTWFDKAGRENVCSPEETRYMAATMSARLKQLGAK